MKTLLISSEKGGVGRTTIALNLAYALAKRGWRTSLVDLDPQGGVGRLLSPKVMQAPGLCQYALEGYFLSMLMYVTRLKSLQVLPFGPSTPQERASMSVALGDGALLKQLLDELETSNDIVIFDAPSGFGPIVQGAYWNVDSVISPLRADPLTLRGIPQFLEQLAWIQEQREPLDIAGFIINMWDIQDPTSAEVVQEIQQSFPEPTLFRTMLPLDRQVMKAAAKGVPLGLLSRNLVPTASLFDQLAMECESKLSLIEKEPEDENFALVD